MNDCVFCRIVRGELPSTKVYETGDALAFLDIAPVAPGHTLLIPKKHYANVMEMPADELAALARHLPEVVRAVREGTAAEGVGVIQLNGSCAGQVVMHLHFHLIPRTTGDGIRFGWPKAQYAEGQMARIAQEIVRSFHVPPKA